ncbi:MAG: PilT/PilU family type 4a pilus ATPase [Acidobacteria bacterium]|nr:PilT/PilU family type 4a pilus ATPase [Acidobacteriota bacterium]
MAGYDPQLEDLVRRLNQARPGQAAAAPARAELRLTADHPPARPDEPSGDTTRLDQLLRYAVERGASDLILTDGCGAALRIQGKLVRGADPVYHDEDIRGMIAPLLTVEYAEELQREMSLDFSFVRPGIGRFRTNLHFQRGTLGVTLRSLPREVPTLESLHMPRMLEQLADRKKGLILVTGSAGSGKTSTLAAMIGLINRRHPYHIVTIEDPIEYRHQNQRAVIEQIEVGRDARSFSGALRSILRQSPDVILLGEIRDTETMAAAITAAETGHLVLATLHTNDAVRAVGRVVDGFPADQQNQVRQQLSLGLAAVIAQQLVPAKDGPGRYPAVEVLMANHAVSNLIRKGEDHMLRSQLSLGRTEGMVMMEESLADLVRDGKISTEEAYAHCLRADELRRYLVR